MKEFIGYIVQQNVTVNTDKAAPDKNTYRLALNKNRFGISTCKNL